MVESVPLTVCEVVFVMKSELDSPVSAENAAVAIVVAGAEVSKVKATDVLALLILPAMSVIFAVRDLAPSAPRSAFEIVKSMQPSEMLLSSRMTAFGVAKDAPPKRSSTLSPATALEPVPGRVTRNEVVAADSAMFRYWSATLFVVCSVTDGATGAVVSNV